MPGTPSPSDREPRRILVRGVNWLGDAVMTTPALLRLRERFPGAHLTLLTPGKLADLWQHHPALDEVVTFGTREGLFTVAQRLRLPGGREDHRRARPSAFGAVHTLWEATAGIVSDRFDLALVLPNSPRSALEVWLARVPQRIGYARKWRNGFLTRAIPSRSGHAAMEKRSAAEIQKLAVTSTPRKADAEAFVEVKPIATSAHQMHEYLHLAAALGADPTPLAPRVEITDAEVQQAAAKFGLNDALNSPFMLLGLNPGAEYGPAKRWPADRFIEAAALVQRRVQCRWLVFGGLAEAALAEKIAADIAYEAERPPTSGRLPPDRAATCLAGKTSLRELMALLKMCRVLLTNDTGPMHVAAALGTPVVVPFGSTSPDLTAAGLPGDSRHRFLKSAASCAPCFLRECPIDFRCMKGISVERVAEAVQQLAEVA